MGCNCGGGNGGTPPLGSTVYPKNPATQPSESVASPDQRQRPATTQRTESGRNGSTSGTTESFTLRAGARTQSFGSKLEAEAARVRNGGRGTVSRS